ncbi:MAG TPA: nucleotidyltransferase domain-containing protein [Spirochaetia bacterium]|nr:nucleotidyltransferase domain-containing protein [Spirochaetia bacterium]
MAKDAELAKRVAARFKAERAREEAELPVRVEKAWQEARELAQDFARDGMVRRVILFGSLAEDRVRSLSFDIDLAIEGGDLIHCILRAEKSSFKVDVVDLKTIPEAMREQIRRRGVVLYEGE